MPTFIHDIVAGFDVNINDAPPAYESPAWFVPFALSMGIDHRAEGCMLLPRGQKMRHTFRGWEDPTTKKVPISISLKSYVWAQTRGLHPDIRTSLFDPKAFNRDGYDPDTTKVYFPGGARVVHTCCAPELSDYRRCLNPHHMKLSCDVAYADVTKPFYLPTESKFRQAEGVAGVLGFSQDELVAALASIPPHRYEARLERLGYLMNKHHGPDAADPSRRWLKMSGPASTPLAFQNWHIKNTHMINGVPIMKALEKSTMAIYPNGHKRRVSLWRGLWFLVFGETPPAHYDVYVGGRISKLHAWNDFADPYWKGREVPPSRKLNGTPDFNPLRYSMVLWAKQYSDGKKKIKYGVSEFVASQMQWENLLNPLSYTKWAYTTSYAEVLNKQLLARILHGRLHTAMSDEERLKIVDMSYHVPVPHAPELGVGGEGKT